jgi:isoquinoline 1-oxidoreductase beta subunit
MDAEGTAITDWKARSVDRRTFMKVSALAGGGFVLAFWAGDPSTPRAQGTAGEFEPNAFLKIDASGSILIYSKNPEVGQGIKTAFPMIIAEELDADWSAVRVEQSRIDASIYGRQAAGGSRSIPSSWDQLRQAGAVARAMLVEAASLEWDVSTASCVTEPSVVLHPPSGRRLAYGDLAARAATLRIPDVAQVPLKDRNEYRLLGSRITGVDNRRLVTGEPLFGIDQVVPGMLYASYLKCPATGGRVRSANLEEVRALPGVKDVVIVEGNNVVSQLMPGVAVVADSTWAAFRAKAQLRVEWDESDASTDSWSEASAEAESLVGRPGSETILDYGDVDAAFSGASRRLEAFYTYPFVSHAPLEPQNCTADYRDGSVEIWAPTQTPDRAIENAANVLGVDRARVLLHQTRIGGGFGRRLVNDYVCEAVAISKAVGAPVKLQWTREDDMAHDFYRPGGFHSFRGALDDDGKLLAWEDHFITFTSDGSKPVAGGETRGGEFPEGLLTNFKLTQSMLPLGTPTGAWRAPRSNAIAFAVQSFHHELAAAAGRDHLEFLLETLGEPRWLEPGNAGVLNTGRAADVVRLAAEKAGWGRALPAGRGLGLAFYFSHAGHFAEVAEVSVDDNRRVTVHKVTVAGDVGPIVNLSGAESQCQGAVIDGLSTMSGLEITIEEGRVQQSNFHEYPILRIGKEPQVDVHFIESDYSPTGLGEPALPPLAPAVCNAIFAATGHRVRTLPLSREGFSI